MSHVRVKTKYYEEGPYGSEIERTLFVHHNNSTDYVYVYDDEGKCILSFNDTIKNNLYDAIVKAAGVVNHGELPDGLEYMAPEESDIVNKSLVAGHEPTNEKEAEEMIYKLADKFNLHVELF